MAIEIESIAMIISKRYFVLSDKFLIAPKNSYRQAILTKKMLSTNLKTVFFSRKQGATCRHRALLIASLGLFIVIKTKATLKHSTLKSATTSSFRKALL